MSTQPDTVQSAALAAPAATLSRRHVFAGAGAVGALAAVAAVLPASKPAAVVVAKAPADVQTGGYQLTDHVKRYYETARV